MAVLSLLGRAAAALALSVTALAVLPAQAAEKKAPACAAVSFRPLEGSMTDGDITSGHYRSRFGTIDVVAHVSGGQAQNYSMLVNRKPITPLQGEVPKSSYKCLQSKHVKTPPQPIGGACTGSRFRVVIDSSGKQKLLMLYALQGDDWKLCQAGSPG